MLHPVTVGRGIPEVCSELLRDDNVVSADGTGCFACFPGSANQFNEMCMFSQVYTSMHKISYTYCKGLNRNPI